MEKVMDCSTLPTENSFRIEQEDLFFTQKTEQVFYLEDDVFYVYDNFEWEEE